ncbi:MAG TPA: saccharopine dehydrogenase NADP-binding domain-containing protein [Solirubrobacterales bacterium]|jgi:short subunit dehydrogenase-like uncharacterized protein|nr:saccharopine dehydrogenase NADP-binding domain-containing protein [Solirubrobacterales bacterium]
MANEQTGPIAVYGATGYTGRLVAAELRRRDAEAVLSGRNPAKLEIVSEDLGGDWAISPASLDDPAALHRLLLPCAAVIACAGPFERHGEPVLRAAIEAGTHYLDTTGEQRFMRRVFEEFGPAAADAGVALIPAMGFDYVPGDMLAALTAEGMGPLDELVLAYGVSGFGASRGTLRSVLEALSGDTVEWRDSALRRTPRGLGGASFDFPAPRGRERVVSFPSGEHLTVPRHLETRTVRTLLTASTVLPFAGLLAPAAPLVTVPIQLVARTPMRRLIEMAIGRLGEGPRPEDRREAHFDVVCEAIAGASRRLGTVSGRDVYGLTARSTVEGAVRCATAEFDRSGPLAPSEAFDPHEFLASVGLSAEVTDVGAA